MLLHNGGCYPYQSYHHSMQTVDGSHYPYHQTLPQPVAPKDEYFGLIRTTSVPHHHAAVYPGFEPTPAQNFSSCPCPAVPSNQTFLHQILMGQGYRNSATVQNKSNVLANSTSAYSPFSSSCALSSCCFGNAVRPSGFSSIQQ